MRLFGASPESRTSACVWIPGSRQRVRAKRGPMTGSDARPGMTMVVHQRVTTRM
jgi:hypothetical protein